MAESLFFSTADFVQHALVIVGDDLLEVRKFFFKIVQNLFGKFGTRLVIMLFNKPLELVSVMGVFNFFNRYKLTVQPLVQVMMGIKHIGYTTTHSRSKVTSGFSKDYYRSSGHVFKSVVTASFDNRSSTRIAHAETFTCNTVDVGLTTRSTKERDVTDDDVLICLKFTLFRRKNYKLTAGKTFSEIVV